MQSRSDDCVAFLRRAAKVTRRGQLPAAPVMATALPVVTVVSQSYSAFAAVLGGRGLGPLGSSSGPFRSAAFVGNPASCNEYRADSAETLWSVYLGRGDFRP
jgi:hypothetical protein